ncbi:gliding motility protein RemB [Mucilaginibacter sp. BT774]|uniref:gliding motility protein RemB n=1 Tax=Mucilaginibacter sp. BT774 TaxID=3062276 RepID=UPI0026757E1C|nr:gliding motility protein RemB [Mucilaginibacter sp. BT774]MDO3626821.1 gliding motility protein RemB [Mucilaginibacter sp. BT774]
MKKLCTCIVLLLFVCAAKAQLMYQPYSYQFYQKLNNSVYSPANNLHTSLKPYLIGDSSAMRSLYDSLLMLKADNSGKSWLYRKLFRQHLIEVNDTEYTFFLDYLPDLQIGREFNEPKTVWMNTRGYQLGGTIGSKFFFYTSGYENQGKFANYETDYINSVGVIPGQAFDKSYGKNTKDWSQVTALIGYAPTRSISIELGEDKTFIGDGYRSVLLSDYAAAYPLLRFKADLGKHVQYMAMWAYMQDQYATQFNSFSNNRRKWGAFHYIDWNITNRASIGFFNALIAEEANDAGQYHGFDANYINPAFFVSSLGSSKPAPDHTLFGFNGKYKVLNKTTIYGQFLYDQDSSVGGNSKYAWQVGFRGSDLLKVSKLNYLFEYNSSKPGTYASQYPIVNYTQFSESLADPLGSDFKEAVGIINYSIGKFDLQGQLNYAKYAASTVQLTGGTGINSSPYINSTGQTITNTLKYAEGTVAYVLNPKYNLRLEIGGLVRQSTSSVSDSKTAMFIFGLRSTFRDLYHDF